MFLLYGASTVRAMRALNALNMLSAPQVRPWLLLPAPRGRSSATRVPQLPGCRTAFGCCSTPPAVAPLPPGCRSSPGVALPLAAAPRPPGSLLCHPVHGAARLTRLTTAAARRISLPRYKFMRALNAHMG